MNIVFDLGGVVFQWEPDRIIQSVFNDPEMQKRVKSEIFDHPDWVALDRGTLQLEDAVQRGSLRSGAAKERVEELFARVPTSLLPIQASIDLMYRVKRGGSGLFILSNMHVASIRHLERENRFWEIVDGAVISCRVKLVKPEAEIYTHLLDTFSLRAGETVFIDDSEENLRSASEMGITPILFSDPRQCEDALLRLGCRI